MTAEDLKGYGAIIKGSLYEAFMSISISHENMETVKILGYAAENSRVARKTIHDIRKSGKLAPPRLLRLLKVIERRPSTLTRNEIQFYLLHPNRSFPGIAFERLLGCLEEAYNSEAHNSEAYNSGHNPGCNSGGLNDNKS